MLMLAVSWLGSYFILRKKEFPKLYLYALIAMTFSGCFATIAGWYVTEIGRQPWLVQDVLLTKDALGPVTGGMVFSTLMMYLSVYAFLTISYVTTLFYLAKKAGDGSGRDPEKQVIEGAERHANMIKAD